MPPDAGIAELSVVRKQFELKYGKGWITQAMSNSQQEVHYKASR